MLRYLTIPVTAFQQNCSLVWCDATRKAAVIDPGGDLETLLAEIQRLGLALEQIWWLSLTERGQPIAASQWFRGLWRLLGKCKVWPTPAFFCSCKQRVAMSTCTP